jgi:hypothetical protein
MIKSAIVAKASSLNPFINRIESPRKKYRNKLPAEIKLRLSVDSIPSSNSRRRIFSKSKKISKVIIAPAPWTGHRLASTPNISVEGGVRNPASAIFPYAQLSKRQPNQHANPRIGAATAIVSAKGQKRSLFIEAKIAMPISAPKTPPIQLKPPSQNQVISCGLILK